MLLYVPNNSASGMIINTNEISSACFVPGHGVIVSMKNGTNQLLPQHYTVESFMSLITNSLEGEEK